MRTRGGRPSGGSPQPQVTTRSWATAKADHNAPEEWLRRSYTRTIPKDLRTIEQLRLSFEDARQQWAGLCDQYEGYARSSANTRDADTLLDLPPGIRSSTEQIVSQLKAIKQELLSQLTRMQGKFSSSQNDSSAATPSSRQGEGSVLEESWLRDLVVGEGGKLPRLSDTASDRFRKHRSEYLMAVWLARRVWVWAICIACVTMDLELLSGSVSLSTQLFFGCPFDTSAFRNPAKASEPIAGLVLHSCYDLDGAITEDELHGAIAPVQPDGQEACEIRAFFASPFISPVEGDVAVAKVHAGSSSHSITDKDNVGAHSVTAALPNAPVAQDAFWVHAIALCYSAVANDDVTAARLLSFFDNAHHTFSKQEKKEEERERAATPSSTDSVREDENGSETMPSEKMLRTIAFVLQAARLMITDDYSAVQRLWQREGYLAGCATSPAEIKVPPVRFDAEGEAASHPVTPAIPLSVACPEASILVLLTRLLGEHVVRRRWTEQGLGQAFRPIEPTPHTEPTRTGEINTNSNRLASALCAASFTPEAHDVCKIDGNRSSKVMRMCSALQVTALRNMGGDWPIPGPLLRGAFGGV